MLQDKELMELVTLPGNRKTLEKTKWLLQIYKNLPMNEG
jgi:hypothetical protein